MPVCRPREIARDANKRTGNDAADFMLAAQQFPRRFADAVQFVDGDDLFMRRDLEDTVARGVDDRLARAHMLFAQFIEDHRPEAG